MQTPTQHMTSLPCSLLGAEEEAVYIERVVVHLHPTFRPSTLNLTQPPFAVRRLGWGYFVIRADVIFKPEWGHETLALQWMLDFENQGSMRQIDLELEHQPAPSPTLGRAPAAEPAGPPTAGGGGAAADAGASSDDFEGEDSEEGSEEDSEEEDEEAGSGSDHEFGERGGDYDLSRFLRTGWRESPPTSASEGDPASSTLATGRHHCACAALRPPAVATMACASAVTVLAPARVKALLRGPNNDRVCVIDVRDADFAGGHIRGAVNVVAETFEDNVLVDRVVSRFCRGMEVVIVHCYLSQQRGPYCAQRLAERLEAQGCSEPEICVMAGGWKRFRRELEVQDFELVEDFD
ncbi:hypothetical protein COHA_004003 [Chlorella ohadii]|uniref:Protein-tyrosine-phosphatase n=1 Tax=Chlorella ohadii TaxID=2649997 RepID=A0AAD5DTT1_9CHLO|nr:hypothetical protein COHA_004003 [Chlorella ohadii]